MRKLFLIASVASLAIPTLAIPGMALAQPECRDQQHDNRVAGTLAGAGMGALIGSAVAGPGSRGAGAVVGAVGGGAVGNAAGGSSVTCDSPAGYYDDSGTWHAASGYYDGDGHWVDGARPTPATSADNYSADVAYVGPGRDLSGREDWMERRIQAGEDRGALSHFNADGDRSRLSSIRDMQGRLRDDHDGLSGDDRADLGSRLDDLNASVNAQWRGGN
jgi:hypothetical protein